MDIGDLPCPTELKWGHFEDVQYYGDSCRNLPPVAWIVVARPSQDHSIEH